MVWVDMVVQMLEVYMVLDMVVKQFQLKQVLMVYLLPLFQFHNTLVMVCIELLSFNLLFQLYLSVNDSMV
jgi:hypothetical protein